MRSLFQGLGLMMVAVVLVGVWGSHEAEGTKLGGLGEASSSFWSPARAENGGVPCNACVIMAQMFIVKLESEPSTIDEALHDFCSFLPSPANSVCREYVNKYGATLVDAFFEYESADRICAALGLCTNPEQFVMYPGKAPPAHAWEERKQNDGKGPQLLLKRLADDPPHIPEWLLFLGNRLGNDHLPLDDFDNDYFSPLWRTLRGRDWRGQDCND